MDPTSGPAPLTVQLDGSSSSDLDGDELLFLWDFGDGEFADGAVVSHTYDTLGQYTIELTVTDEFGNQATARRSILVTESRICSKSALRAS